MSLNLVARELFSFYDVVFPWFFFFFQCLKMYTSALVFEVGYPSLIKAVCVVLTSTGWLLETFLLYSRRWRYSSSCGLSVPLPLRHLGVCSRSWQQICWWCGLSIWGFGSSEGICQWSSPRGPWTDCPLKGQSWWHGMHSFNALWDFYLLPFFFFSSSFPSNQWGPFLQFCMLLERHRFLHNCDI